MSATSKVTTLELSLLERFRSKRISIAALASVFAFLPLVMWLHYCFCIYYPPGDPTSLLTLDSDHRIRINHTHIVDWQRRAIDFDLSLRNQSNLRSVEYVTTSDGIVASWIRMDKPQDQIRHFGVVDKESAQLLVRYHDQISKQVVREFGLQRSDYFKPYEGFAACIGPEQITFLEFNKDGPSVHAVDLPDELNGLQNVSVPNWNIGVPNLQLLTRNRAVRLIRKPDPRAPKFPELTYGTEIELWELSNDQWRLMTRWPIKSTYNDWCWARRDQILSLSHDGNTIETRDFEGQLIRSITIPLEGKNSFIRPRLNADVISLDAYNDDDSETEIGNRYFDLESGRPLSAPDMKGVLLYRDKQHGYCVFEDQKVLSVVDSQSFEVIRTLSAGFLTSWRVEGGVAFAADAFAPTRHLVICTLPDGELVKLNFDAQARIYGAMACTATIAWIIAWLLISVRRGWSPNLDIAVLNGLAILIVLKRLWLSNIELDSTTFEAFVFQTSAFTLLQWSAIWLFFGSMNFVVRLSCLISVLAIIGFLFGVSESSYKDSFFATALGSMVLTMIVLLTILRITPIQLRRNDGHPMQRRPIQIRDVFALTGSIAFLSLWLKSLTNIRSLDLLEFSSYDFLLFMAYCLLWNFVFVVAVLVVGLRYRSRSWRWISAVIWILLCASSYFITNTSLAFYIDQFDVSEIVQHVSLSGIAGSIAALLWCLRGWNLEWVKRGGTTTNTSDDRERQEDFATGI